MAENYRNRRYIAKDFDTFRNLLLDYAKTYYPDKITDFSESSMGGIFLDFASYVGDVLSFYMDHQYAELDPELVVETQNLEKLIKNSGIKITGTTPASVDVTIFIRVPAGIIQNSLSISTQNLPVIKEGSMFSAKNGVNFRLLQDVDFSDPIGRVSRLSNNGSDFIIQKIGKCLSGGETTEDFNVGNFEPFKKVTLRNPNVTKIISVTDSNGNDYYEVNSLTEEVVYKNVIIKDINGIEREIIKMVPAPYRFTTNTDLASRKTTLTFGGGSALNFEDDVIPDPADFALTLYGTSTFSRDLINPANFLNRRTLGVVDENVTIQINYMYGGGLSNNVPARSIENVTLLKIVFPENPPQKIINSVKNSVEVTNEKPSIGGANEISSATYKDLINQAKNSQMRIVTKEDLLARIYSMPSNFGRVFRAGILKNEKNNLITDLYIVCKNNNDQLEYANDYLKDNLITTLETYKMLSEVIEIYDSLIINFNINANITVDPAYKKTKVIQDSINKLKNYFRIEKAQINQPLNVSDIRNAIYSVPGVLTVSDMKIINVFGTRENRKYSNIFHDFETNRINDLIFPPIGGIFELKFKENDVKIFAS